MDYGIGSIILKKNVVNTDKTTEITATAYGSETYLPESGKPYTKENKNDTRFAEGEISRKKEDGRIIFQGKRLPILWSQFHTG